VAQGVGPEFKPQYRKKQNKMKKKPNNLCFKEYYQETKRQPTEWEKLSLNQVLDNEFLSRI
jgi:hypothetical protein